MKRQITTNRSPLGRVSIATRGTAFSVIEPGGLHEPRVTLIER